LGDREVLFNATVDNGQTLVSVQEDEVIIQNSSVSTASTSSFEDESDDDQFENESSEVETGHEDDDD
jgi:hypothetical protein